MIHARLNAQRELHLNEFLQARLPHVEMLKPTLSEAVEYFDSLSQESAEERMQLLDYETACGLGLLRPAWRKLAEKRIREMREIPDISRTMMRFVFLNPMIVRKLDFYGCAADSSLITLFIKQCWLLEELSVMNSKMSRRHLIEVLDYVRTIRSISFSVVQEYGEKIRIGCYPNIIAVKVDCNSSTTTFGFLTCLLNAFTRAESLEIHLLPKVFPSKSGLHCGSQVTALRAARWATYKTVLTSFSMLARSDEYLDEMLHCIYGNSPRWPQIVSEYEDFVLYERTERRRPRRSGELLGKNFSELERYYTVELCDLVGLAHEWNRGDPLALRIVDREDIFLVPGLDIPMLKALSSLTELDLTESHGRYTVDSWSSLVSGSPKLTALAASACSVEDWRHAFASLKELKLKRLQIEGKSLIECKLCAKKGSFNYFFLGMLTKLESLEEFTLVGVGGGLRLFEHIYAYTNLITVRLDLISLHKDALEGLVYFMYYSRELRALKLQASNLQIDSKPMWRALKIGFLRKLCLSTNLNKPIDLSLLENETTDILRRLDILHIHAGCLKSYKKVQAGLQCLVDKANQEREGVPLRFVNVNASSFDLIGENSPDRSLDYAMPGREICCVNSFTARCKPHAWEL